MGKTFFVAGLIAFTAALFIWWFFSRLWFPGYENILTAEACIA
jgi:hypothetical protein